jgi:hypothetical protein
MPNAMARYVDKMQQATRLMYTDPELAQLAQERERAQMNAPKVSAASQ